jgi:hypothetical protein
MAHQDPICPRIHQRQDRLIPAPPFEIEFNILQIDRPEIFTGQLYLRVRIRPLPIQPVFERSTNSEFPTSPRTIIRKRLSGINQNPSSLKRPLFTNSAIGLVTYFCLAPIFMPKIPSKGLPVKFSGILLASPNVIFWPDTSPIIRVSRENLNVNSGVTKFSVCRLFGWAQDLEDLGSYFCLPSQDFSEQFMEVTQRWSLVRSRMTLNDW